VSPENDEITLGGRRFRPCRSTTLRQDAYVQELLVRGRLGGVAPQAGEAAADFMTRVAAAAIGGSVALELVAALLEPVDASPGAKWSADRQRELVAFLGELDDPASKTAFYSALVEVLSGFFVAGLPSSKTSPTSSAEQPSVPSDDPPFAAVN
jgi:hypothetical protein